MSGTVRVDPQPIDLAWAPPTAGEPAPDEPRADIPDPADTRPAPPVSKRRGPMIVGAIVLAIALLAAGLWASGAFRVRTDRGERITAGRTISTGPYEMSFSKVSVQKVKEYSDDQPSFVAQVTGLGATTGDESIEPDTGDDGMFVLRDEQTSSNYVPSGVVWGTNNRIGDGSGFTPGLPPVPFTVKFKLPATYTPSATLTFAVFDLELRDNSLLGDGEPGWHDGYHYYAMALPVQRLPDDTKK